MSSTILLQCTMCGTKITVEQNEINMFTFCPHCGKTNCLCIKESHTVNRSTNENLGTFYENSALQSPASRELIIRGVNHLRNGFIGPHQQAWQAFVKVTETDPRNYRGWLGYFIAEDYRSYRARLSTLPKLIRSNDMNDYYYNLDEVITKWRVYLNEDGIYIADPNREIKREKVFSRGPKGYYLESQNTDWETDICCLVLKNAPDNLKSTFSKFSFRSRAVLQTLDNLDSWISVFPSYIKDPRKHKELLHFLSEAQNLVAHKRATEYKMQSQEEYYKYLES